LSLALNAQMIKLYIWDTLYGQDLARFSKKMAVRVKRFECLEWAREKCLFNPNAEVELLPK
jgi:hypothetical protein